MIITLSLCPTDNRLRIIGFGKNQLVKSQAYRDWWEESEIKFNSQCRVIQLDEPSYERQMSYTYRLFLDNKRKDIGNFSKALADFLKGKLFTDDRWIKLNLELPVRIDKLNPRVEIDPEPQVHSPK